MLGWGVRQLQYYGHRIFRSPIKVPLLVKNVKHFLEFEVDRIGKGFFLGQQKYTISAGVQ